MMSTNPSQLCGSKLPCVHVPDGDLPLTLISASVSRPTESIARRMALSGTISEGYPILYVNRHQKVPRFVPRSVASYSTSGSNRFLKSG